MLFWSILVVSLVLVSLAIIFDNMGWKWELPTFICGFTGAIGLIAVIIMVIFIGIQNFGVDGYIERMNTRREMLVYQYENDIYDNDNDLGKRELMKDIQDWNEDLAAKREVQDDFWIGIFHPNIYDQFEFIELDGAK